MPTIHINRNNALILLYNFFFPFKQCSKNESGPGAKYKGDKAEYDVTVNFRLAFAPPSGCAAINPHMSFFAHSSGVVVQDSVFNDVSGNQINNYATYHITINSVIEQGEPIL